MNSVDPLLGQPIHGLYMHSLFIQFYTVFVLLYTNFIIITLSGWELSQILTFLPFSHFVPNNVLIWRWSESRPRLWN